MAVQDDDVLRTTVIHEDPTSGEMINVYQHQVATGTPIDNADALDDVLGIMEDIYQIVKSIINIGIVLREVGVINITQDVILGSGDLGAYTGGTAAGEVIPQGAASFAHFQTVVPRVILSKYLPAMSAGTLDADGTLSAAALVKMGLFAANMLVPVVIAGKTYTYGYDSPKIGAGFVVPVAGITRDVVAYQRRRKPGRGS